MEEFLHFAPMSMSCTNDIARRETCAVCEVNHTSRRKVLGPFRLYERLEGVGHHLNNMRTNESGVHSMPCYLTKFEAEATVRSGFGKIDKTTCFCEILTGSHIKSFFKREQKYSDYVKDAFFFLS